ncbi:McrC family protein [Candidatus Viadribacter manganicus]|uniref:Restriction endonuclease n=1 Tax=Candidatus Viadribacter manganicus TaxID=1759059 RepID=A0A1B1AHQ0_9PROT|nr:hypothetical protein [Candidatus Viadribacter manganicus]ANP46078.1 hypothetical protein ATE48_09165 [Candidatus Viadribacter manganicus]
MRRLEIFEHQTLEIGQAETNLRQNELDALDALARRLPPGVMSGTRNGVRFGSYCGVVCVGDLSIEVLPKIERSSPDPGLARGILVDMLRRSGQTLASSSGSGLMGEQSKFLLDVFILSFCSRVARQLSTGTIRKYVALEENIPAVRGRILMCDQARASGAQLAKVWCRFDEFVEDNEHNRVLKSVLAKMHLRAAGPAARKACSSLLDRFADITSIEANVVQAERLKFDRSTEAWRPIFEEARRFLRCYFPDVRAGRLPSIALMFDMNRVFEGFLGWTMRTSLRHQGVKVVTQGPKRFFLSDHQAGVLLMRPDVVVLGQDHEPRLICDAKWKRLGQHGKRMPSPADLYQIASYGLRYQCAKVALVYPTLSPSRVRTMSMPDSTLRVAVVELDVSAALKRQPLPAALAADLCQ